MTRYETVLFEVENGLATLTLNRPDARNGMTNEMVIETYECLLAASHDPGIKVLVLTGAGNSFCPGADIRHFSAGGSDRQTSPVHFQVPVLLHEMPAVTV